MICSRMSVWCRSRAMVLVASLMVLIAWVVWIVIWS